MKIPGEVTVPNKVGSIETRGVRATAAPTLQRKSEQAAGEAGSGVSTGVDVQLTGAARGLAAIEQGLRELPVVDEARVAAVRKRLDDGSYTIDPQRIADRLLQSDRDIGRASPLEDRSLR